MAYIYKITNQKNQKSYIGKTEYYPPDRRWKQHIAESKKERSSHRALYQAFNKYGIDAFSFEVLKETENPSEEEQYYIQYYDTYHNGYNETLGGDGASYLELPEQDICKYYLKHSLLATAKFFGYDIRTINKILYKNNIQKHTLSNAIKLSTSYAVAKLDPLTNEILEIYPSVREAERANGNTQHIYDVVKGKRKICKGFKWKRVDDLDLE